MIALVRSLLGLEKRRIERATSGPFDAAQSQRLDRIITALEALVRLGAGMLLRRSSSPASIAGMLFGSRSND